MSGDTSSGVSFSLSIFSPFSPIFFPYSPGLCPFYPRFIDFNDLEINASCVMLP